MKAVYRSIKPYWLYLILIGKKMIEVGKDFPKVCVWNKEVFLHCSKDIKSFKRIPEENREWMRKYLGKVACRFVCDEITPLFNVATTSWELLAGNVHEYAKALVRMACLTEEEMHSYAKGENCYAWHISDLVIYDKPKELGEFKAFCKSYYDGDRCDDCKYFIDGRGYEYDESDCGCNGLKPLERPPQSWMYVEVEG